MQLPKIRLGVRIWMDRAKVKNTRCFVYSRGYEPCLLRYRLFLFFLLLLLLGLRLFRVTTTLKGGDTSGGSGDVLAVDILLGVILKSMVAITTVTLAKSLGLLVLIDIGLVDPLKSCLIIRLSLIRTGLIVLALVRGLLRGGCSTRWGALAGVLLVPLVLVAVLVGLSILVLPVVLRRLLPSCPILNR